MISISSSRLFNFTFMLSCINLLLTSVAIIAPQDKTIFFAWIFLYMPVLWCLWIACVFFSKMENAGRKLIYLWGMIDFSVLLLFISFARHVENWSHARGVEFAIAVPNFPVLMPTLFLSNLLPDLIQVDIFKKMDALPKMFSNGLGDALAIWIPISLISALQSFLIYGMSRIFKRTKARVKC